MSDTHAMIAKLIARSANFVTVARLFQWRACSSRHRERTFMIFEGRPYSYGETYARSLAMAHLFADQRAQRIEAGELASDAQLAVGIYSENTPEFVFATFATALTGSVLFCLNTGLRGDTLGAVINQADLQLLLVDAAQLSEIAPIVGSLSLREDAIFYSGCSETPRGLSLRDATGEAMAELSPSARQKPPRSHIRADAPFIVIYTSGTTGLPKGVPCSQLKLAMSGVITQQRIRLRAEDRGYLCMPLFHSNAWFLGVMPLLLVAGSFVLTRRFSASAFEADMLNHGISYLNYVGQPIHYILAALERKHGTGDAVTRALARHPQNRFRIAHGNGATALDREKLQRCLGMAHIYEVYGSTEATISTVVQPGDPVDSVGEATSRSVVILNEAGECCPVGEVDCRGRLTNYQLAVGEISKKISLIDELAFGGYFKNAAASQQKYRDGYFRSGDLGHIRLVNGRRYLYFNGRTDDWIRKDGENFSAESVAGFATSHDSIALAVAYGVPAPVADEHVMIAVQLSPGAELASQELFDHFLRQQQEGGMDPKWMPDYVRVVEQFEMTKTGKIMVRPLKQRLFRLDTPGEIIYFRRRGDTSYHRLTDDACAAICSEFAANGREALIDAR